MAKLRKKVVVIDDDAEFAASLRGVLEDRGYEVFCAGDGVEGIGLVREVNPHAVVLDVMMKTETEGFDISRKLEMESGVPVILLTGIRKALAMRGDLQPDKRWLPVHMVLEKPVAPARLILELERIFRSRVGKYPRHGHSSGKGAKRRLYRGMKGSAHEK